MNLYEFLFNGIKVLKDENGVVYVHAKDFPILIKRLELLDSKVFGVDVFELRSGKLVYKDTFIKRSSNDKWYVKAYTKMLRYYPNGWFSPTYVVKTKAYSLTDF